MKRLLIVEDDHFYSQRIRELLEGYGINVKIVRTVQDALKENPKDYCAAIIDVMLPNDPEKSGIGPEETRGGYCSGLAIAKKYLAKQPKFFILVISSSNIEKLDSPVAKRIVYLSKEEDNVKNEIIKSLAKLGIIKAGTKPSAFIVHGHDEKCLKELKTFIKKDLRWPAPFVLREQTNGGKTIIEKFEEYSNKASHVFVLLTPDDVNFNPKSNVEKRQSRPNVIFELGYFYGFLGRTSGKIIVLRKGDVDRSEERRVGKEW